MFEYGRTSYPEFSAAQPPNGNIYHVMGAYKLHSETRTLIPVNRSYAPHHEGTRQQPNTLRRYRKDSLIHEKVTPEDTGKKGEVMVDVYGTRRLFIRDDASTVWYSSELGQNKAASTIAQEVAFTIQEGLAMLGIDTPYRLGMFGSHQPGLNIDQSDFDLIAWINWNSRREFKGLLRHVLNNFGYISTKEDGRDLDYADLYAQRHNIPRNAGKYMADKRNRWNHPNGSAISVQLFNQDYDHGTLARFLESMNGEWESAPISTDCKVVESTYSANFPRMWKVEIDGQQLDAVSFSKTHQAMGDDDGLFGEKYKLNARRIRTEKGEFIYLAGDSSYLLPTSVMED